MFFLIPKNVFFDPSPDFEKIFPEGRAQDHGRTSWRGGGSIKDITWTRHKTATACASLNSRNAHGRVGEIFNASIYMQNASDQTRGEDFGRACGLVL